jgi:GNAT superfamily N-acetyltransferase
MYLDLAAVYPAQTRAVEESGGFDRLEDQHALGALDFVVLWRGDEAVAGGGPREARLPGYAAGEVEELRKVFVRPAWRRSGAARAVVLALEDRAADRGARLMVLETGTAVPAAARLYEGLGYQAIERFDPHPPDPTSLFFGKRLR